MPGKVKKPNIHTKTKKSVEELREYEKQKKKKQREKIRADPGLHKIFLETQKKNYYCRKEKSLIKSISELKKKEQTAERKK